MRAVLILAFCVAVAAGANIPQRIVGGTETTINQYPFAASLLIFSTSTGTFVHNCGGAIINNRSILSAAHCFHGRLAAQYRSRVGSTEINSGGTVYNTNSLINHAAYNPWTVDNDIAVLRIVGQFVYNNVVQPGSIPSAAYNLGDNQSVWAIGWGWITESGPAANRLRHVEVWTVNQAICASRYAELGRTITQNMLCSGWLDVGGRDQCQGDSGGPLLHNNIIVGVCSWGAGCGRARYPGVNARVSRYPDWIQANA